MKHSSTDESMKSQKGSGLEGLDYLEPYRIGTSGIREIPIHTRISGKAVANYKRGDHLP